MQKHKTCIEIQLQNVLLAMCIQVRHTGADLLHEAFFKFTGPIRSEINLNM